MPEILSDVPKKSFIHTIRFWGVITFLTLLVVLIGIHTFKNISESMERARQVRQTFITDQRSLIKLEVDRVSRVVDFEVERFLNTAKSKVKNRAMEAHAIASNLYEQNRLIRTKFEIEKMVIDALRPIRYDNGLGYYFINGMDGIPKLIADQPEREGKNILDFQDKRGKFVARDMLDIIKNQGEGFYSYFWLRPGDKENEYEKISYVKKFEPFDWLIGTGVYLYDVELDMHRILSGYVATHRFGPNEKGYVFINELLNINGGKNFARVYANPNRPKDTGKLISDDYKDARGKQFRKEFLNGLRKSGECYVDYWYHKLDDPEPSPKTSYFKLAGNRRFIVAAGVYLDDIEDRISQIHTEARIHLVQSLIIMSAVFIVTILSLIALFSKASQRLEKDFNLVIGFFRKAADSSEFIDQSAVRFSEMDQLAGSANQMLADKQAAEDKYRLVVENANDAIFISRGKHMLFFNPVSEKLIGYPKDELYRKNLPELIHPDDRDAVLDYYTQLGSGIVPAATVDPFRVERKNGEILWVQINIVEIEWEGQPAVLNLLRDITDQKNLEKQLIQSQKSQAIGTLAGGIAHDFNNILFPIIGYSEMLKEDLRDDPVRMNHADKILQASMRAKDLVKQILTFSRQVENELQLIKPQPIFNEAVKLLKSSIPATIRISTDISEDCGKIMADPTQLQQLLMNLVTNAYHAMLDCGGEVRIILDQVELSRDPFSGFNLSPGSYARLKVIDTGCGIDKDTLKKIFDPYFTTKDQGKGTGLGLAIVQGIVRSFKGEVHVYSEPGQGTEVQVYLPAGLTRETVPVPAASQRVEGGKEHILIVDDEKSIIDMVQMMLERLGYKVTQALGSLESIDIFKASPQTFDLMITDMAMPDLNGLELSQAIREVDPQIPIIICTGFSEQLTKTDIDSINIQASLGKPLNKTEIAAAIRMVLDMPRTRSMDE